MLEIVKRLDSVKKSDKIFLLGIGQGAQYAEAAACELGDKIAGMIFYYPKFEPDYFSSDFIEKCYQEDQTISMSNYISKYRGPVMLVHGERDKVTDMDNSQQMLGCYDNAVLNILPKESHEFSIVGRKKAIGYCTEFIEKHE